MEKHSRERPRSKWRIFVAFQIVNGFISRATTHTHEVRSRRDSWTISYVPAARWASAHLGMVWLPLWLIVVVVLSGDIGCLVSAAAAVIDLNFVDLAEMVKVTRLPQPARSPNETVNILASPISNQRGGDRCYLLLREPRKQGLAQLLPLDIYVDCCPRHVKDRKVPLVGCV